MYRLSRSALFALIGAHVLNLIVALLWPNVGCSFVATGLFVTAVALLFRADVVAMWLLLPFIIAQLSVMVSLLFIEAGSYMVEMGEGGHPSSASASFGAYSLIFLLTSQAVFRRLRGDVETAEIQAARRSFPVHLLFQWVLALFAAACVGYVLIAGLRTGFPLLSGMDRFVFRRLYADVLTVNILDLKFTPPIVLGALAAFAQRPAIRKWAFAAFAGLMLSSFLYGEKFFIILVSIGSFIVPFVIRGPRSAIHMLTKAAPMIAIGVGCVLAATYVIYSDYGARSSAETLSRLGDRVSEQGQIWFVAVEHASRLIRFDIALVERNLASLFAANPQDYAFQHHLAVLHFIYHYAPPAMYRSFQHNAGFVTPTMGYEAYGLVMFGYVGVAVQMLLTGVFLGWLLSYLCRMIVRGRFFAVLLPAFILNQTVKLLSQGTLYILLSVSVFKAYAAFLVLQLLVEAVSRGLDPAQHDSGLAGEATGGPPLRER